MGKKKSDTVSTSSSGSKKSYKSKEKLPALGEISHVSLTTEQEDNLLELFKVIDKQKLYVLNTPDSPVHKACAGISDSSSSTDDLLSDEESSDSMEDRSTKLGYNHSSRSIAVSSLHSSAEQNVYLTPTKATYDEIHRPIHSAERKRIIRQMIRDDRRKHLDIKSAEKDTNRAAKQYVKMGTYPDSALSPVSSRIRVSVVYVDSMSKQQLRSYVIARTEDGINDLHLYVCRDFKVKLLPDMLICIGPLEKPREISVDILSKCDDGVVFYVLSHDYMKTESIETFSEHPNHSESKVLEIGSEFTCWTARCDDMEVSALMKQQYLQLADAKADILDTRRRLPIFSMREQILYCIRDNQVTVIAGDTGSG